MRYSELVGAREEYYALWLRLGLGLVFIIGGWNKLYQLLDPDLSQALVASYTGATGYINQFFADYLFTGWLGAWLTPWSFLAALSWFELIGGLLLVAGLLVRPLALIFGLLVWTFVMALPVLTVPGIAAAGDTYLTPALLVQIRDVGLSGMMFVIYNLGSGAASIDNRLLPQLAQPTGVRWKHLGVLLRLSIAVPLLVGGFFQGLDHIATFGMPAWLLIASGLLLLFNVASRVIGLLVLGMIGWYIGSKISLEASLIQNLNGFKRELAFVAGAYVLMRAGGGGVLGLGTTLAAAADAWRSPQRGRL